MKVCIWPDGTWCDRENLEEFLNPPCAMSDDFLTFDIGDLDENRIEEFVQSTI